MELILWISGILVIILAVLVCFSLAVYTEIQSAKQRRKIVIENIHQQLKTYTKRTSQLIQYVVESQTQLQEETILPAVVVVQV